MSRLDFYLVVVVRSYGCVSLISSRDVHRDVVFVGLTNTPPGDGVWGHG